MKVVPEDVFTAPLEGLLREPQSTAIEGVIMNTVLLQCFASINFASVDHFAKIKSQKPIQCIQSKE